MDLSGHGPTHTLTKRCIPHVFQLKKNVNNRYLLSRRMGLRVTNLSRQTLMFFVVKQQACITVTGRENTFRKESSVASSSCLSPTTAASGGRFCSGTQPHQCIY